MNGFDLDYVRSQIIGSDLLFETPFGERNILYADYTASGRGLKFIENRIVNILRSYANTHTEDDFSGKYLTRLFHAAQKRIKDLVNAGEKGKVICVGSGSTGALKKLQEIIGVYIPPVTEERIFKALKEQGEDCRENLRRLEKGKPVVFIGPYEHHTNELMWREALVDVVVIGLDDQGRIDLQELEAKLGGEDYAHRQKVASFSAGSNITGIRTDVYEIARICHRHDCLIFYDFAAVAPYIEIDMNRDKESYFDAIFFSLHKFLGGPGASGVLVFREELYRQDLPPTAAGGGTVDYVGFTHHDFSSDIETRETAGTPPILQTIKTALVMDLKDKIGVERIEAIESDYTRSFLTRLKKMPNIIMVGRVDPEEKIPIISFNIRHRDRILHPKFVTKLLNDLFGIQSRAGCSCAGPYGHILLGIGVEQSSKYRGMIVQGLLGLKPGWVRINIHYTSTPEDVAFLSRAIEFVAQNGHLFLSRYTFDIDTGEWTFSGFKQAEPALSIDDPYETKSLDPAEVEVLRESYFKQADEYAERLRKREEPDYSEDSKEIEDLKFFYYCRGQD